MNADCTRIALAESTASPLRSLYEYAELKRSIRKEKASQSYFSMVLRELKFRSTFKSYIHTQIFIGFHGKDS